jgi:hypothetical protein
MERGGACRRGRPEETVNWRRPAQLRGARVSSHVRELEIRSELPNIISFLYDYSLQVSFVFRRSKSSFLNS